MNVRSTNVSTPTHTLNVVKGRPRVWRELLEPLLSVFVTLRYFENFLPLTDSRLCRLEDDVNIMG